DTDGSDGSSDAGGSEDSEGSADSAGANDADAAGGGSGANGGAEGGEGNGSSGGDEGPGLSGGRGGMLTPNGVEIGAASFSGVARRAHRSTWQTDAMESLELPLTTERLRLRPHRTSDAEALLPIHSREDVARYLLKDPWTAEAAETEIVKRLPRTGLATESRA